MSNITILQDLFRGNYSKEGELFEIIHYPKEKSFENHIQIVHTQIFTYKSMETER